MLYRQLIIVFLCIGINFGIHSQSLENVKISLLTCGQGDQLYSTFGHSAVRIQDDSKAYDVVYNYGTFDFDTEGFYIKFMRGKLPYYLSQVPMNAFLREYQYYKRSVVEQQLNLTKEQKRSLISLLQENALPQNKFYPYDFFFDNCSTRIRVIVEEGTDHQVKWPTSNKDITRRDQLWEFLTGKPWSEFGIDLVIGAKADQEVTVEGQMFLPEYLSVHFENGHVDDRPLVSSAQEILSYTEEQQVRMVRPFFTPHILFLILLILEVFLWWFFKDRPTPYWLEILNKLIFLITGIGSLIMIFLWFFTDHQACSDNWNLIWASPFFLVYPFIKRSKLKRIFKVILIPGLSLAIINTLFPFLPQVFSQYNLGLYALLLWLLWDKMIFKKRKESV